MKANYRAFHGTNCVFKEFECPAYFSGIRNTAEFFAKRTLGSSYIMECDLSFENPFEVSLSGQSWGGFVLPDEKMQKDCIKYCAQGDEEEEQYFWEEGITVNILAEFLETLGYDGIILHNCYEEDNSTATQLIALKKETVVIKSVSMI